MVRYNQVKGIKRLKKKAPRGDGNKILYTSAYSSIKIEKESPERGRKLKPLFNYQSAVGLRLKKKAPRGDGNAFFEIV